jgi:hypothetical protein
MKIASFLIFNALVISSCFACAAADFSPKLSYSKRDQKITSNDKNSFLVFKERNEGNTSYFFDYFGGYPSIVHDNDSLDSYSTYLVIEEAQSGFRANCLYADFKSGSNGLMSKSGRCGLGLKFANKTEVTGKEGDAIISHIVNSNNKINTSYFISGEVKYLPIMVFQNKEKYVYQVYKNKDDLENGQYEIVSCKNDSSTCDVYDNNTWVVVGNSSSPEVHFEVLNKSNKELSLDKAIPSSSTVKTNLNTPFEIKSLKANLRSPNGVKLKSYLVKGDKVTLLAIDGNNQCSIKYINRGNKTLDGNVFCSDLNLFN